MWSEELSLQQDDDSLLVSKFSVREMLSAGPARRRGEEVRRAEPVAGRLLPAPEEGRQGLRGRGPARLPRHGEPPLPAALPHDRLHAAVPQPGAARHELLPRRRRRDGRMGLQQTQYVIDYKLNQQKSDAEF